MQNVCTFVPLWKMQKCTYVIAHLRFLGFGVAPRFVRIPFGAAICDPFYVSERTPRRAHRKYCKWAMTYVSFCVLGNSLMSPESRNSHLGQLFVLRFAFAKRVHVGSVVGNAEMHIRHSPFAISGIRCGTPIRPNSIWSNYL